MQQLAVNNQALEQQDRAGTGQLTGCHVNQHCKVSVLISAVSHAVGVARSS